MNLQIQNADRNMANLGPVHIEVIARLVHVDEHVTR